MSTVRCFVAAALPPEVATALGDLQQRLRADGVRARWVRTDSMHLTLKFIGEVELPLFKQLHGALDTPLPVGGPLHLQPRGVGTFPPGRRAKVVWAGLSGDLPALTAAARTIEERVTPLGVPRERRLFHPHLTLGRARGPGGLRGMPAALEKEAGFCGPTFAVHELILYESQLRPEGASYTPHLRIPFG